MYFQRVLVSFDVSEGFTNFRHIMSFEYVENCDSEEYSIAHF